MQEGILKTQNKFSERREQSEKGHIIRVISFVDCIIWFSRSLFSCLFSITSHFINNINMILHS